MGSHLAKNKREAIIVEGLSGSGKTSLLCKLRPGPELSKYDMNRDVLDYKGETFVVWDLYGRDKSRPVFIWYARMTRAILFLIDSSDRENLDEALDVLVRHYLLEKYGSGLVVLVLANKQDIPGALTALEIQEVLEQKYKFSSTSGSGHTVLVRPCSAETMEGVDEAFKEFVEQMRLKHSGKSKPGLIPLASKDSDANVKDGDMKKLGIQTKNESLASSKAKSFLKNPFCLFRATD